MWQLCAAPSAQAFNRLQSASTVIGNQVQNLTAAEDNIRGANITQESEPVQFNILNQTGISALAQQTRHTRRLETLQ